MSSFILSLYDNKGRFCFDRRTLHCNFKGSSTTNVQSYKPTAEEIRLQRQAADYSEAVSPNALRLNNTAAGLLWDSLGSTQVDFARLNNGAQAQINNANNTVSGLLNGQLPTAYQQNMENAIKSGVQNSMGSLLTDLGSRGVINSSVMNQGIQGINDAAAEAMTNAYTQNIGTLSQLAGQQIDQATAGITAGAAAQEAAQQPALNLWNASVGLNQGGTLGALAGVSGKGTTTTKQSTSGGGFFDSGLGGLFGGLASGWASTWCFAEDTLIKMADGTAKFIQDVVKGDKVLCPHADGTESVEEVTDVMEPHHSDTYAVTAKDKDGNYHVVFTTSTQPLLCADGTFVTVGNMKIGKTLYGGLVIQSIEYDEFCKVYDLKVSGENNYYADGFVAKGGTTEW